MKDNRHSVRIGAGRRIPIAVLAVILLLSAGLLWGCGEDKKEAEEPTSFEIAMISGTSGVEDGSFLETTWKSIRSFCESEEMTCKAYSASENSEEGYLQAVETAKAGGAKVIVFAGSNYETTVHAAQSKYEDLYFILLDGVPRDEEHNYELAGNSTGVLFAEEQAGYLAGYAAVADGYTKLGFLGGEEVPSVERFGFGYLQGIAAASRDTGAKNVSVKYAYTGTFEAGEDVTAEAEKWYREGTQVIFACSGGAGRSVIQAANETSGSVIGADTDQSGLSEQVITSAKKEIHTAIDDILRNYKRNNFGGKAIFNYDLSNKGVSLEMTNARFKEFDQTAYETLTEEIKNGERKISKEFASDDPKEAAGGSVSVEVIEMEGGDSENSEGDE